MGLQTWSMRQLACKKAAAGITDPAAWRALYAQYGYGRDPRLLALFAMGHRRRMRQMRTLHKLWGIG